MTIPYESLLQELVRYLNSFTHNYADAQNLADETICRLIPNWQNLQTRTMPEQIAWCKRVGHNLAVSEGRTKKRSGRPVPYEYADGFKGVTVAAGAEIDDADPGDSASLRENAVLKFTNFVLEGHAAKREHLKALVNHVRQGGSAFDATQRNNKQLIKKVLRDSLSRREFFSVAATLFAASDWALREWAEIGAAPPRTILRVEELTGVLRFTSALRFHEGDIFTCRRILDPLLANQLQCWRKGPQTADAAEACWISV